MPLVEAVLVAVLFAGIDAILSPSIVGAAALAGVATLLVRFAAGRLSNRIMPMERTVLRPVGVELSPAAEFVTAPPPPAAAVEDPKLGELTTIARGLIDRLQFTATGIRERSDAIERAVVDAGLFLTGQVFAADAM